MKGEGYKMTSWTTKDGRVINITDMETDHLINIIRFIERRANPLASELRLIELGKISSMYDSMGDTSQYAMDGIIDQLATKSDVEILKTYHEPYKEMLEELNKRNNNQSDIT